jgi:hypothetical protein
MTVPSSPGPGRASIISPLVHSDRDNVPPVAARALLTDERDRRAVLVELRLGAGADPESIRQDFLELPHGGDAAAAHRRGPALHAVRAGSQ